MTNLQAHWHSEKEKVNTINDYIYYYLPVIASVSALFILSRVHHPDSLLVLCDTPITDCCPQGKDLPATDRNALYQNFLADMLIINGIRAGSDDITEEAFHSLRILPSWMFMKYIDRSDQGTRLKFIAYGSTRIITPCLCYGRRYAIAALRFLSCD